MTILKKLRPHGTRLSLVAFCLLSVWPPLSAQTGKELMADACYNEVHQREQNALWASQVQRRTADHVYLEEEIETVEGFNSSLDFGRWSRTVANGTEAKQRSTP
jgi:hypothetical protein